MRLAFRLLLMCPSPRHLLAALCAVATMAALAPGASAVSLTTIAHGLAQPKKVTVAPDGELIVALSGDGAAPSSCTDGNQLSCLDHSGAIDAVTPAGAVSTLLSGLPSISAGHSDPQATGPAEALLSATGLRVLFQGTVINSRTGAEIYGSGGSLLETFSTFSLTGTLSATDANLGRFEARYNPDHGRGTDVTYGDDAAIDSDPYGVVAYRGGYAFADAGANDVLWLSPAGRLSLLAVLPPIRERAPAGTYGKRQKRAIEAYAQSVPTALAVGPDGALYAGELGGTPGLPGKSSVYRIVPGHRPTVFATGLSAIEDISFDARGRLLVLELDHRGFADPGIETDTPASGALIRISHGRPTTLIRSGLTFPTGMAVTRSGTVYLTVDGVSSDGRLVRVDGLVG